MSKKQSKQNVAPQAVAQKETPVSTAKEPKVKRLPRRTAAQKRNERWGWLFILPWVIGTLFFFAIPMVNAARFAFTNYKLELGIDNSPFVGFDNFVKLFAGDGKFIPALFESLGKMLYEVPVIVVFSVLIAMVLRGSFKGHTFFRAVFFFPVIIASGVCITILRTQVMMTGAATSAEQQAYMFNLPDFKILTDLFGLPQVIVDFATSVVNGFFDITWKSGVQIILLLVAVNHISPSYYEVADMEGATAWEKLWKVTIPMIAPTILVVIIYTIIDSFTDYGNVIMKLITEYRKGLDYSYATTIGLSYFLIVGVIIALVALMMRKVTKNAEY